MKKAVKIIFGILLVLLLAVIPSLSMSHITVSSWGHSISVGVSKARAAASITTEGTKSQKASTTVSVYLTNAVEAGDLIIGCWAGDEGAGSAYLYTDQQEDATLASQGSNAGQAVAEIWYVIVEHPKEAGTLYFRFANNNDISKAGTVYKVTGMDSDPLDNIDNDTGSGTTATVGTTGTMSQDNMVIVAVTAVEDEVDDAHGSWTEDTGYVYGNEQFDATNGGGDASNIQVHSVAKSVTDGTSQAYQGADTGHDSTDWAGAIASYKVAAGMSISNTPSTEALGVIEQNSTTYAKGSAPNNPVEDGDCTFTITNDGAVTVNITIEGTDAIADGGTTWSLVSGSPGENEIRDTAYYSGQDPSNGVVLSTSAQAFYNGLTAESTIKWDFKRELGTITDGISHSSNITLTAVLP